LHPPSLRFRLHFVAVRRVDATSALGGRRRAHGRWGAWIPAASGKN